MGIEPSRTAQRLAPKLIAVGSEWGANVLFAASTTAIAAGNPMIGALCIGLNAAFLFAKNWSQGITAAEGQAAVEQLLKDLVIEHKSLQGALDALATDQHLHELISRERVTELQSLLRGTAAEVERRIAENQEITFHLARFLESWCSTHKVMLESIAEQVTSLSAQIETGFRETQIIQGAILKKLDGISGQLAVRPLPPGAVPVAVDPKLLGSTFGIAASKFDEMPADQLTALQDTIRGAMHDVSQPLLNWKTTVGKGQRLTPSIEEAIYESLRKATSTNLILGPKGSGKSAISAVVGHWALANGFVVLGIRADQFPADPEQFWKLPISIEDSVRVIAKHHKVLLLLDQLDAISELSDRHTNRLNFLLNLIRRLSGLTNIHIAAACREFDYRHDARLSTIEVEPIHLTLPEWVTVSEVLRAEGSAIDSIAPSLQELLRTPWHLSLFLQVAGSNRDFASLQSLIEAVWKKCVINSGGLSRRSSLTEKIALLMSENEELFVPSSVADDFPDERDALIREEILVFGAGGRSLSFRHQTFYDFSLARLFTRGGKDLSTHVLERQDGLFVRPGMLNALEMLRATSSRTYHREVKRIFDSNPRLHIRKLLLEFLARQSEPDDDESRIILPLIATDDGPTILSAATGSRGWFVRLRDSGKLALWMTQPKERAALCFSLVLDATQFDELSVYRLAASCWGSKQEYDELVLGLIYRLPKLNDDWMRLASDAASRSGQPIVFTAARIAEANPEYAVRLIVAQFGHAYREAERKRASSPPITDDSEDERTFIKRFRAAQDDPFVELITGKRGDDRYGLDAIARKAPRAFLEGLWKWFMDVLDKTPERHRSLGVRYEEDFATSTAYGIQPLPLLVALHAAADAWATADPLAFAAFAERAATSKHLAVHRILAQALTLAADKLPKTVLAYLVSDARRLALGTWRAESGISRKLIAAVFPSLSVLERQQLEEAIIRFDEYSPDEYDESDPETRFELKKFSRQSRLRLLRAIPIELISAKALGLKQNEEVQLSRVTDDEMPLAEVRHGNAPMTAESIQKAKDEDVLHLMDRLVGFEKQVATTLTRRRSDFARRGGVLEEAYALQTAAESNPERVTRLLTKLSPEREDHQQYAGFAIEGLAKSKLAAVDLFSLISELDSRGFRSDEFRGHAASAIDERARKQEPPPANLVEKLTSWMDEVEIPKLPDEFQEVGKPDHYSSFIWELGAGGVLMSGRGAIFRAIAQSASQKDQVDIPTLLDAAKQRVGKESHPKVAAEMLFFLHNAFTQKAAIRDATNAYDGLIKTCPRALHENMAISALANLTGYFDPPELFENWLTELSRSNRALPRQAFGELLFLYYCRQKTAWADERIEQAIAANDDATIRGMAYGAARAWTEPHCRRRATDVLCAAAKRTTKDFTQIVESAFILTEDEPFPIDADAQKVIKIVNCNQPMLRAAGPQILEALAPVAGTEPEIVLVTSKALLAVIGNDVRELVGPLGTAAASLTTIAITLHRQTSYRAEGLTLFESLLKLGVGEAAAALELLDRKPYIKPAWTPPLIRRHRRR